MQTRPALVLAVALSACGPQVDPSEATDTEQQATGSESGNASSGSDSTAPDLSTSGSTGSRGTTTSQGTNPTPTSVSDSASVTASASASASASGGETTGGADILCECFVEDGPLIYPGCDLDELCDPIVVSCDLPEPSQCTSDDLTVLEPELLECHRDAIVAGDPGFLRWELPYPPDAGAAGQRGWVVLQADQTALFWDESWGAGSYAFSAVEAAQLDSEATLSDCDALATPEATMLCLYSPVGGEIMTCTEAYDFPI